MADKFDEAAKTLIQQLSIAGESFTDLRYVEWEIAAALRAVVPEGFVIVPKEPTEEMIAEMDRRLMALPARERIVDGRPARLKTLATIYRFMIEARPGT